MQVIVLRGIPGAGKSTYARKEFPLAYVVSADSYFTNRNGEYRYESAKLWEAHAMCLRKFVTEVVNQGSQIVVDNTNIRVEDIAPYAAVALAYGYDTEIITISATVEEAAARCIHSVPKATIERMQYELLTARFPRRWRHRVL